MRCIVPIIGGGDDLLRFSFQLSSSSFNSQISLVHIRTTIDRAIQDVPKVFFLLSTPFNLLSLKNHPQENSRHKTAQY